MRNTIAFQKGIIVIPSIGIDNRNLAMTVQAELMQFGYMLTQDAFQQLGYADAFYIKEFHNEIIDYLKLMTGSQHNYKPVYSGFPQQVMEMSELELWVNQIVGYLTGGTFKADEWTKTKGTAFEQVNYKMIDSGNEEDFKNIFTSLAKAGTSLTPMDMKVIVWFVKNYDNLVFPEVIPFKENLCTILGTMIAENRGFNENVKLPKLTTTDVLRIVVYLSGGNISLPALPPQRIKIITGNWRKRTCTWVPNPEREKFKFRKFTRSERRDILTLLENSNLDVRDMKLKEGAWIRLGEILHPGEYATRFPKSFKVFQQIRNEKVKSWYGQVDKAFQYTFEAGLTKLMERPGEFLRRLDWLVRTCPSKLNSTLSTLAKVGRGSSNKVLFEVYNHFENRKESGRKIMIKNARKHVDLPDLLPLPNATIEAIQETIWNILKEKFAELPELGDCWIDPELKKVPLPTNMRSLNDSLIPIVRGTRTPFGTGKKVIRPSLHWFDQHGNLDLDLHGFLLGEDNVRPFGFNGVHNDSIGCYSGDVRHRQGACAEYVDIDVAKALQLGFKYFLMIVHNFQGGKLSDIKDCMAGVQEREFPEANMYWKPETVENCMLLNGSDSRTTLIAAFDLETREYIYLDLDFGTFDTYVHSGQAKAFFNAIAPYIAEPKVSVYHLLQWHVEARGRMVTKETATTHFLFDDFKSSYVKTIEFMGV